MHPRRRHILIGLAALPFATPARAQMLDATALNLVPGSPDDQSGPMQDALLRAASEGRPLFLPSGTYLVQNLHVPSSILVTGVPGGTVLGAAGAGPVVRVSGSAHVRFEGIRFGPGSGGGPQGGETGLIEIEASDRVVISGCEFAGGGASGIAIHDAAAEITGCDFSGHALAAIFSLDSRGLTLTGNRIVGCGNGGILVWGNAGRSGSSTIAGNAISGIGASNGGNGQNGNGINIFRCDDVIIADNRIRDCAFTAIRLNATRNVIVSGNLCANSGEVAIFSEFAFTGSVIADNIVDGAALGISVTNMDSGGEVATVSGNIVRNIRERSEVNPDTRPVGIYAEADTAITGNTVHSVVGMGIRAGNGPFLRNVVIADNIVRGVNTGIGVSVVRDPAIGPVSITGNLVADVLDQAIVGLEWERVASDDLVRDAAKYPHVNLAGNRVV